MKKIELIIPTRWLSALINSDLSGYEQSEIDRINTFKKHMIDEYGSATALSSGEPYISARNDAEEFFGQAIDEVSEVTFPITYKGDLLRVTKAIKAIQALKEITPDNPKLGHMITLINAKIDEIKGTQLPDCDGRKVTEMVNRLKNPGQDSLSILSQSSKGDQEEFIKWFDRIVEKPDEVVEKPDEDTNVLNPGF